MYAPYSAIGDTCSSPGGRGGGGWGDSEETRTYALSLLHGVAAVLLDGEKGETLQT